MIVTHDDIIREGRTWIDTPYHLNACIKGVGADCGRWIYAVMMTLGLVPAIVQSEVIDIFSPDWSCHTDDEKYRRYIFRMIRNSRKILEGFTNHALHPLPGTIALLNTGYGKVGDHGGLVTSWPMVIHAVHPKIAEVNASANSLWQGKHVEFFDPLGGAA